MTGYLIVAFLSGAVVGVVATPLSPPTNLKAVP